MKSQVFANFTEIWLPLTALIIFVSIFSFVLIYISRSKTKRYYDQLKYIALDDGDRDEG